MPDRPILIVEHSPDLATLYRRTLEDEGLLVAVATNPTNIVEAVRAEEPQLVVLDVLPYGDHALEALDELRTNETTRELPVVVITTSHEIADASTASYNVRVALVKPFDLDKFVEVVRHESGQPTMHADIPDGTESPGGFMDYAERVLATRSRDIIFRWIQRLRQEPPWAERDDLGLGDLIDHAPVVLQAIDVRLHYDRPEGFFERHPDALARARNHAYLRRRQQLSQGAALREYAVLREEVWLALRTAPPSPVEAEEFFQVERAINGTVDAIVTATSAAFADEQTPPGTTDFSSSGRG